jgi:hypothetical protein
VILTSVTPTFVIQLFDVPVPIASRFLALVYLLLIILALTTGFFLVRRYHDEQRAFVRYQRWGRQKLEEMLVGGAPGEELLRLKNRLIDAPDATGGFRSAFMWASEVLPPSLRDDPRWGGKNSERFAP